MDVQDKEAQGKDAQKASEVPASEVPVSEDLPRKNPSLQRLLLTHLPIILLGT